nr:MAG TPA: hypothetical protein [Bacteriophage sp.]
MIIGRRTAEPAGAIQNGGAGQCFSARRGAGTRYPPLYFIEQGNGGGL